MSKKQKPDQKEFQIPSKQEMQEALLRSGYLMEGRLVKVLDGLQLFVDSNNSYLDERTGVSREVDLIGETARFETGREKVCVKTVFAIEAINNLYPVILLTEQTFSPNVILDNYIPSGYTPGLDIKNHPFDSEVQLWNEKSILKWLLFCQYCAFLRKKNDAELFASHSEDLHASINKAVEYSLTLRSFAESWINDAIDSYWRIFQWRPVVVLRGDLYKYVDDELKPVDSCKLVYNLHFKSMPVTVVVDFVTESGLPDFVNNILVEDDAIEEKLHQLKMKRKL